jgi:NADPH:quinone reductase-like Zn-dependent oxidoreductase
MGRGIKRPTSTDDTIQAVVQNGYGSAEVLQLAQVARPVIADDEVLMRVHAAGLDRGTCHLMTGQPYLLRLAFGLRRPKNPIPGREVAGTVVAVGPAVVRFSAGDEVYGIAAPHGSFAEYAAAREDKLARKPGNLSFEQAAVVPVSAMTALQALTDIGHVRAGQQVLVTGASGGVGSFAVQLARAFGAEVTGIHDKHELPDQADREAWRTGPKGPVRRPALLVLTATSSAEERLAESDAELWGQVPVSGYRGIRGPRSGRWC